MPYLLFMNNLACFQKEIVVYQRGNCKSLRDLTFQIWGKWKLTAEPLACNVKGSMCQLFLFIFFLYAFIGQKDCAHVTLSLGDYDIMNQDCLCHRLNRGGQHGACAD